MITLRNKLNIDGKNKKGDAGERVYGFSMKISFLSEDVNLVHFRLGKWEREIYQHCN